jgi:hypothetical protein
MLVQLVVLQLQLEDIHLLKTDSPELLADNNLLVHLLKKRGENSPLFFLSPNWPFF